MAEQKKLELDLFVAESGVRTDLREGVHLIQVVLSTAWMTADQAAEFLKLTAHLAGVRATFKEIPKVEEKNDAKARKR